jgi:Domain of unknown function (DUF4136)
MPATLTRRLLPFALVASFMTLAGCATPPDVRVSLDRSVDFTKYRTFAFVSPLGTDRGGYQSLVSQHLKAATQREMESRGMRLDAAAPELLINFSGALTDKLRVTTAPAPMMGVGYYGYRGGMYSTWPMYADETVVTPYKEGTLNIDIIDARARQLVWESVVTDSVTQKDLENVQVALDAAVAAAFAKYPVPGAAKAK